MGEARRRGTFEERKLAAIAINKNELVKELGGQDERLVGVLGKAIDLFLSQLSREEWQERRNQIVKFLADYPSIPPLATSKPLRFREDEIGWYLFLCQQTVKDPLCVEAVQQQRVLPFFAGIGERSAYAKRVAGLERKIEEILTKYKATPDGALFEILVALSYASKGWEVELLEEAPPAKTPDMIARKNGKELYVECKRLERRTAYSEKEKSEALRLWGAAVPVLTKNRQWVWLKTIYHVEVAELPTDFLANILKDAFPLGNEEKLVHDSQAATIYARLIDREAVNLHLENYSVKDPSPMLSNLLGDDWAPENAEASAVYAAKRSEIIGCEASVLGTHIEEISWASGMTRIFDSEKSIDKKARDITHLLSKAVKQVLDDSPSVIHVAAETLEGRDVEMKRTEKVMSKVPYFITDKPVWGVRFHRLQSNSRTNMLYEFDETVEEFQIPGVNLEDIPVPVVSPLDVKMVKGRHWEIYD